MRVSVVPKNRHNKILVHNRKFFKSKFASNIALMVILVLVLMVASIEFCVIAYSKHTITGLQNNLVADFISDLQVFRNDVVYNNENITNLPDDINAIMTKNYKVKYMVITDENMSELHSTLPEGSSYIYLNPNNPASFKLKHSPDIDINNNTELIYIKQGKYNIYFGISKSIFVEEFINDVFSFISIFFVMFLVITIWVGHLLSNNITKPLEKIENSFSKLANGDMSVRLDFTAFRELNNLILSYNMMVSTLQRLYSTLEQKVQMRTIALENANKELKNTQAIMVHSEKMKSLGELVAGIMHEINNPINFIYGNLSHLDNYSKDLMNIIEKYDEYVSSLTDDEKEQINNLKEKIDYDFIKSDLPDLIKSCKEGADRAKNIIRDLKSFSRMEEAAITDVDLVSAIDTTLNILHNKIKHKATVHKEYIDIIPKIEGYGGQLNQVFMNILDNAVGAIKEQGDIWIRIKHSSDMKSIIIEFEDNGIGMNEDVAAKIFDPFFTTKPVGQGTGLGMSITHKIIKSHNGDIQVSSKPNVGTKFTITLPIKQQKQEEVLFKAEDERGV